MLLSKTPVVTLDRGSCKLRMCCATLWAGHPSKHTISTSSEKAGELLSSSELEARRPDGFKFITAPVLRGEGNWPSISLYAPMEQRIHVTVDALLARIPFWLKVPFWQGLVFVLASVGSSSLTGFCNHEVDMPRLGYPHDVPLLALHFGAGTWCSLCCWMRNTILRECHAGFGSYQEGAFVHKCSSPCWVVIANCYGRAVWQSHQLQDVDAQCQTT